MIVEIKREKQNPKAAGPEYRFERWIINKRSDIYDVRHELNLTHSEVLEYLALNKKFEEAEETSHTFHMMANDLAKGIKSYTIQVSTGDYHITITLEGEE